ncbi:Hint domain-containing protein [Paracoccus yeei]|nr:Hint domain-containing protein [Paracoccus yeei]
MGAGPGHCVHRAAPGGQAGHQAARSGLEGAATEPFEIFDVDFAVCYLRGTRIMTAHGEVAVEDLKEGGLVVCRFGGLRAARWIRRQSIPGTVQYADVRAIRFAPGLIADAVPRAPLFVSAGHSMLIGESLVLASDLMNGITITRDGHRDRWDYFQIDLGVHDLVLANGAWSETFADCGRFRDRFDNVMDYRRRLPRPDARPSRSHQMDRRIEGWAWRICSAGASCRCCSACMP